MREAGQSRLGATSDAPGTRGFPRIDALTGTTYIPPVVAENHMPSALDPNEHPGRFLGLGLVILAITALLVLAFDGPAPIVNQTTISECGPGENPSTAPCYDPHLPSE